MKAEPAALRSGREAQGHAMLAKEGVKVPMSDVFGVAGQALLDTCALGRARTQANNSAMEKGLTR